MSKQLKLQPSKSLQYIIGQSTSSGWLETQNVVLILHVVCARSLLRK